MPKLTALTVTQLNRYVKSLLEGDRKLEEVYLKGEISNLSDRNVSGHIYFTLKDSGASIRAVMFRSQAQFLRFSLEDGMAVLLSGSVSLYERDGVYQFYVTSVEPDGVGSLQVAYEQRKAKLAAEGLFDSARKRGIPAVPRALYVVTSASGAAFQDVCSVIERRFPACTIRLLPVLVQGKDAAPTIVRAFAYINLHPDGDTVILCRGGGSLEDLWAFNEEAVVRAVAACPLPVISAVGHETDFTLRDFAADLRAPTPSAAAELAVPDRLELLERLRGQQALLRRRADSLVRGWQDRLGHAAGDTLYRSPTRLLERDGERLQQLAAQLRERSAAALGRREGWLAARAAVLDSLSPLKTLSRGYSITCRGGTALTNAASVQPGEELTTRLAAGTIRSKVVAVNEEKTEF